ERHGDVVEIAVLVVDPAHHRAGHGRALLDACVAQSEVMRWIVGTGAANTPAIALYRSMGFEHIETDSTVVPYARFGRVAR
ncbi:MAG: GNAT family N-acetyltransferase, partial [Acidimicrobiia bacterium]